MSQKKQHPSTKFVKIPFVLQRSNFRSAEENETHLENQPKTAWNWKKQAEEEEKKVEMRFHFCKRTNELD